MGFIPPRGDSVRGHGREISASRERERPEIAPVAHAPGSRSGFSCFIGLKKPRPANIGRINSPCERQEWRINRHGLPVELANRCKPS